MQCVMTVSDWRPNCSTLMVSGREAHDRARVVAPIHPAVRAAVESEYLWADPTEQSHEGGRQTPQVGLRVRSGPQVGYAMTFGSQVGQVALALMP